MKDAAAFYRVSTYEQQSENQVPEVERFAKAHGLRIVRKIMVDDSAWKGGGGPEYKAALAELLDGAWRGEYSVVVVWALDRIVRTGAEDALRLIRQFRERACVLLSVRESWLNGSPEIQDVLVAFAGWMGQQESQRRSERTRAGMARAREAGVKIGGRKPGARDLRPRKRRAA